MGAESLSSSKGLKAQSQAADLKHLGFVPKYSTYFWNKGYGVASDLYSATKAYAPDSIKPRIGKLEETVTSYSTPMLTTMQDQGDKVLHVADSQVRGGAPLGSALNASCCEPGSHSALLPQLDSALDYAHRVSNGAYNNVNNLSSKDPAKQFSSARDTIIAKFQETINFVQQNGIAGTVKYTSNVAFQQAQHAKEFVYKSEDPLAGGSNHLTATSSAAPAFPVSLVLIRLSYGSNACRLERGPG